MDSGAQQVSEDIKEWHLEPGTEYRFELEAESSLAVKVRVLFFSRWLYSLRIGI